MFLLKYKYLSIELDVFRILFLCAVARVTETKGVKMSSRSIFSPFLDGMKDYGHAQFIEVTVIIDMDMAGANHHDHRHLP